MSLSPLDLMQAFFKISSSYG